MSVHENDAAIARTAAAPTSPLRSLLFFDTMITPKIITIVYWLLLAAMLIAGVGAMFAIGGFSGFVGGIVTMLAGALVARIWCELLIVLFKINEHARRIAERP